MATRYAFPVRITLRGDNALASKYIGEARVLLGALMQDLGEANIRSGKRQRRTAGVSIDVAYDGTLGTIRVDVSGATTGQRPPTHAYLWIPQGFVLYPVSDTAALGWGVPVIPVDDTDIGPYDTPNLAPGLDVTRWTAGGQLGQVLLTDIAGAGYPDNTDTAALTAALLFNAAVGIRPLKAPLAAHTATWAAYRVEFAAYTAQSPGADAIENSTIASFKKGIFELTNADRDSVGRDALLLPIRGYYDSAQATAEVCASVSVLGHFYEGFPATYRTPEDRLGKDGVTTAATAYAISPAGYDDRNVALSGGENLVASNGAPVTVIGVDPLGNDIVRVPPGPPFSPSEAFDLWLSDPPHRANIESTQYDLKGYSHISAAVLQVGAKAVFYAQHFVVYEQWIAAGNMTWQSVHPEIPILSWYGFNSLNQAFETWPIRPVYYSTKQGDGTFVLSGGAAISREFTAELLGGTQEPTVFYVDHPDGGTDTRTRPVMSNRIFSRGRCIAIAPRGSLVWAAGIQKYESPDIEADDVYRLVALVHHADDQPSDHIANGMTGKLRVWWVDLPNFKLLHANPQTMIRGVYGEEDDTWPWIDKNSPYSWRGGVLVDMLTGDGATEPDLLKYASAWRFSPDALKAVCLRDQGTFAEWCDHLAIDGRMQPGEFPDIISIPPQTRSGQFGSFVGGPGVVYVELTFNQPPFFDLTVSRTTSARNLGNAPHRLWADFDEITGETFGPVAWTRPCAVDYTPAGALKFAFHVFAWYGGALYASSTPTDAYLSNLRQGMVFGDWDTIYGDALMRGVFYSSLAPVKVGEDMFALPAIVFDVNAAVFAAVGRACPLTDDGPGPFDDASHADYPDTFPTSADPFLGGYRAGTFTAECIACALVPTTYIVRLWRDGVRIIDGTVVNSDNTLYDLRLAPTRVDWEQVDGDVDVPVEVTSGYFWRGHCLPSANPCLNGGYVQTREGAWVAAATYVPQTWYTETFDPGADTTLFTVTQDADTHCLNDCGVSPQRVVSYAFAGAEVARDGGGWMTSSFADGTELAARMQIPGDRPRTLYARLV